MKILCICDQGNNRSVHFSHLLKYWNHDTIPIGLENTSNETLDMLFKWADLIIVTHTDQVIPYQYTEKTRIFSVGSDTYRRPFNAELHKKVKALLERNKDRLKDNDSLP